MLIPQYWAEARVQHRSPNRGTQVTLRRFGWSELSQADAQQMAEQRAEEALSRLLAGDKISRREPKVPYNGAEGTPIREQVLERIGDSVITRNAYGAQCLNTPGALFADIDFDASGGASAFAWTGLVGLLLVGFAVGVAIHWAVGMLVALIGSFVVTAIDKLMRSARQRRLPPPEAVHLPRIEAFINAHPEWTLRIYRTPAGLRLLAMHRLFDPNEAAVGTLFDALGVDPSYARMCRRQSCFRARLTAKPWRTGMDERIRPRPGVWPIQPAYVEVRQRWVERYERIAADYAACRYLSTLGSGAVDPQVDSVRLLHDERCRALSELPLA